MVVATTVMSKETKEKKKKNEIEIEIEIEKKDGWRS